MVADGWLESEISWINYSNLGSFKVEIETPGEYIMEIVSQEDFYLPNIMRLYFVKRELCLEGTTVSGNISLSIDPLSLVIPILLYFLTKTDNLKTQKLNV